MILFAVTSPHLAQKGFFVLEWAFMLFALLSFLCVASHVTAQLKVGQLIKSDRSPVPFVVPGIAGWIFVVGVMALLFFQSALYMILVVVGVGILMMMNRRTADEQFGLGRLPISKVAVWSLLIYGAVVFIEIPLSEIMEAAMNAIHLPHPEQQSVEIFRQLNEPSAILQYMLLAVVLSPLIEELFFRGFLLTFFKNYTSSLGAIVFSAGVFAFAHANIDSAIPLWFLGIVLGVAYQHTGSLLLPIGIHACWNFFTAISLILEKGNG
jgi:membrane protease YdiL (CAAX protease family)